MRRAHNPWVEKDAADAPLTQNVMPEYANLLKSSRADHLDIFRDHYPNVLRRSQSTAFPR